MKFTLNVLEKNNADASERRWPRHMFGGRIRISTVALIVAFLAVWWVYGMYHADPAAKPPAPQVVPPGFVPDPNYTWVPRDRLQPPPTDMSTPTPTTELPAPTTTTTTTPPPFQLPCIQPFCTPSPTPSTSPSPSQQPQPGPGPVPTSSLPAR